MAKLVNITPNKTYATEKNAIAAVEKRLATADVRYFIHRTPEGRFFPVFISFHTAWNSASCVNHKKAGRRESSQKRVRSSGPSARPPLSTHTFLSLFSWRITASGLSTAAATYSRPNPTPRPAAPCFAVRSPAARRR